MGNITVDVLGKQVSCEEGTTILQLAKAVRDSYSADIILALRNGRLCELNKEANPGDKITFITTRESSGFNT